MRKYLNKTGVKMYGSTSFEKWRLANGDIFSVRTVKKGVELYIVRHKDKIKLRTNHMDEVREYFNRGIGEEITPMPNHTVKPGVRR